LKEPRPEARGSKSGPAAGPRFGSTRRTGGPMSGSSDGDGAKIGIQGPPRGAGVPPSVKRPRTRRSGRAQGRTRPWFASWTRQVSVNEQEAERPSSRGSTRSGHVKEIKLRTKDPPFTTTRRRRATSFAFSTRAGEGEGSRYVPGDGGSYHPGNAGAHLLDCASEGLKGKSASVEQPPSRDAATMTMLIGPTKKQEYPRDAQAGRGQQSGNEERFQVTARAALAAAAG